MSRGLMCIAICALSFAAASSATAQSKAQSDARTGVPASGQPEPPPPVLRAAPTSLTQPYMPSAASAPGAGLLVDDGAARVAPGLAAGITVTSRAPLPPTTADGLGAARSVIIVTNGKGTGRE